MRYIIFSGSWNEKIGGIVCLHKLCDSINRLGGNAALCPEFDLVFFDRNKFFWSIRKVLKSYLRSKKKISLNPEFITPLFYGDVASLKDADDFVVIYPEITYGNPLRAKNVVRWLLHNPGFHSGRIGYASGDVFFKFNSAIKDFEFYGSVTPGLDLKVIHYPVDVYNMKDVSQSRSGSAYCIRKGRGKEIVHDMSDSILIDNMSHAEVSSVFKSVNTFYSYDVYTAYSLFAIMCGCRSVVIPDAGVSIENWYPNPLDRLGITYGIDGACAAQTEGDAIKRVNSELEASDDNVRKFMSYCEHHFLGKN